MEFVGQQMANILQNIAKTRVITRRDIKHAAALAYLTIYPGTTMFTTKSGSQYHTFNHMPRAYVFYAEGQPNGKASTIWACCVHPHTSVTPDGWYSGIFRGSENTFSSVRMKTKADPSNIYPTLKVEEGKPKIIIETQIQI